MEVTREEQKASNEAQTLGDVVTILVLAALRQRRVDDVAKVRLEANVEKSKKGEDLVDDGFANRRTKTRSNEEILNGLQELHREEKEDTTSKLHIACAGIHPPRGKEAKGRKASRHFSRETHLSKHTLRLHTPTTNCKL